MLNNVWWRKRIQELHLQYCSCSGEDSGVRQSLFSEICLVQSWIRAESIRKWETLSQWSSVNMKSPFKWTSPLPPCEFIWSGPVRLNSQILCLCVCVHVLETLLNHNHVNYKIVSLAVEPQIRFAWLNNVSACVCVWERDRDRERGIRIMQLQNARIKNNTTQKSLMKLNKCIWWLQAEEMITQTAVQPG